MTRPHPPSPPHPSASAQKVRLQTQAPGPAAPQASAPYSGILNAVATIVREEGPRALFRGVGSPVLAALPSNAIVFATEAFAVRHLRALRPEWSSTTSHAVAGGLSGLMQVLVSCPSELVKIQMQTRDGLGAAFARTVPAARHILTAHGPAALFRGFGLTAVRDTSAYAIYFAVYDSMKLWFGRMARHGHGEGDAGAYLRREDGEDVLAPHWYTDSQTAPAPAAAKALVHTSAGAAPAGIASAGALAPAPNRSHHQHQHNQLSVSALMVSGGLAGVASWFFLHPVDVLKSLVQGMPLATPREKRSLSAVFRANMAAEGPRFLLRGLAATCFRAFPASAVTFPVFEWMLALLDQALLSDHEGISAQHAAVARRLRMIHDVEGDGSGGGGGAGGGSGDTTDLDLESLPGGGV
jgi:hypothetical protein